MEKKAIVMGATSGIGLEVAKRLAARGWHVGIAGRRADRLEDICSSVPGIERWKHIDVNDEDAAARLAELDMEMGGVDLYVHSSGIGWQNCMLDVGKELQTVGTNAMGFTRMVTAAFNIFAQGSNGRKRIACITSIARTKGLGAAPAYSATKRYQSHYLECLSQLAHMRRLPIDITDIRPGFVATDLIKGGTYPMQMNAADVAEAIVGGIERGRAVITIDWRYRLLVFFWRLIPRRLWVRMSFSS